MKAAFCIGLLFLASMISSCGGGSGSQTQSQSPSVSALLISPGSASINTGGLQQFFATAELSDGSSKDMTNTRSEEHTSELQSRFGISYAVFCLKKKTT